MNIIDQLKKNEKPFGLMSEEMQAKAKVIGKKNFQAYSTCDGWTSIHLNLEDEFALSISYRLEADYSGTVEYAIYEDKAGCLRYRLGAGLLLSTAFNDPSWIGCRYKGLLDLHANMSIMKNGTLIRPTHVVFKV